MIKLLYFDNLKFLKGKEKFEIFNHFYLDDILKLVLDSISNYFCRYCKESLSNSISVSWAVIDSKRISEFLSNQIRELSSHLDKYHVEVIFGFIIVVNIEVRVGEVSGVSKKERKYSVILIDIYSIYPRQNRKYISRF
ncbi:hypothetical protein F0310_01465 [Borrelia sp. A-FGy1]|uniref:hypothetical protein n=1 Tax=Borrelia sp. A-FGy1 TaxID=2608247 RepID=UPI0015F5A261|nr:hypothetical protein [Borrelia sp. A-FGy1]QMU99094.1 hypothetical protein F0310_01465 [Borrelia sp. A-FGy1]